MWTRDPERNAGRDRESEEDGKREKEKNGEEIERSKRVM